MAKNLQIVCPDIGVNFHCKYEKLDGKSDKPKIIAKAANGKEVKERSVYEGKIIATQEEAKVSGAAHLEKRWCDADGNFYSKQEIIFSLADTGEQVAEISETKIMTIEGFQDICNYTNAYVIDKFYEIYPSDNGLKKDFDRDIAVQKNLASMRKLWEYLTANGKVARGELCTSSRGFIAGDAYLRAIEFGNKWGIEMGCFKEEKIFSYLQEGVGSKPATTANPTPIKRLKLV